MKRHKHYKVNPILIALITMALVTLASGKTIYVDDDATGANDGSSWENAYNFLQEALADANESEKPVEIRVAQGVYKPNGGIMAIPEFDWRTLSFQLINGVTLKGGYAGVAESDPNARDIELYETILSGDLNGDDVEVADPKDLLDEPSRGENSYSVVTANDASETAVLYGFTITGGNANASSSGQGAGGGIYCYDPVVTPPIFNQPIIMNCIIEENSANIGGGMNNSSCNAILINCIFRRNCALLFGGGMNNFSSSPILTNCTFSENEAELGGGMYNFGIFMVGRSEPIIINCTFSGNRSGGISNEQSSASLSNCILWGNEPYQISSGTAEYSNVQGGFPGVGNISADPLFADPNNGDYHLKSEAGRWNPNTQTWVTDDVTSSCIDAGDPNMPVGDEPFPSGIRINMGAYGGTDQASKSISHVPEVVNVNDSDNGSQVTLRQGQILAVTLESNPTTGYSWAPVEKQNSIFEPFGDPIYFPPEEVDGVVGAGGWEIFYFRSVSAGQETLQLVYRRSWETDVEPIKTFSIDVVVN